VKTRIEIPPNVHEPQPLPLLCEWCSAELTSPQLVACSTSHRLKRWRYLHGVSGADGRLETPPEGSPLLRGGLKPLRGSEARSNGAGGLQVSFEKAVRVLQGPPLFCGERAAREAMVLALSDRQRERLEGR
jgi:hypothetical protein